MALSDINQLRWQRFKAHKKAYYSLWIFNFLFGLCFFAEFFANEKPLLVVHDNDIYTPFLKTYLETDFGGEMELEANYRDPYIQELIQENGQIIWPLIRFSDQTINYHLPSPAPSPPTVENWLGTDDKGRDVVARLLYGFRTSILFGLIVTLTSAVIGIALGAIQGFYGGWIDLGFQRFIEVWGGMPQLFILIIMASVITPNLIWLMLITMLFGWMNFVGAVRAEFFRCRNFEYVIAAKSLGMSDLRLIFVHMLPNAMAATLTALPFTLSGSVTILTSLDFLGFGLPPGSPSLGELLAQGKTNIHAPWLGLSAFGLLVLLLALLVFIGEGVRDAFDSRSTGRACESKRGPIL